MQLKICTLPDPILRQKVAPVEQFDRQLWAVADQMLQLMHEAEGVGLAANQVGLNQQLFVYGIDEAFEIEGKKVLVVPDQVIVNPSLTILEPRSDVLEEGCLSIPGLRGPVSRALQVELRGQTLKGLSFTKILNGYEARIVQHEVDHLNGILFLDRITDPTKLRRLPADKE